jgi:hypothetical protein
MALTITYPGAWFNNAGSLQLTKVTATLGVYATGGISLTPTQMGLGSFVGAPEFEVTGGYLAGWDGTASKILIYEQGGLTPTGTIAASSTSTAPTITATGTHDGSRTLDLTAGNALALSTDATQANITGVQAPTITTTGTFTGAAVAAGVFTQVANSTDLSAVTIHIRAFGY